ncbi:hypothetical protein SDJN02_23888, partial [Cucurbita argyrosperma subsp. argyrosperma]
MFLVRLHHFDPLMEATSILAQISNEADLKFSSSKFSLITSYPSRRFVATFQISHRFFANYFVDRNHSSRVSLQSFYNAMYAGIVFSSMTIHFPETTSRMVLQFESSNHTRMQMHRVLKLSPSQEEELGQIQHDRYFSIISQDFRDIITGLPSFPNNSNAVFLFNQLSLEADVKFTHNMFSLTVSNASIRFIIKLDIWDELFAEYSVDPNQCWRISLSTFQKSLWDGGSYSSMTFLMHETRSRMVLEFHNSASPNAPSWHRELTLLPSEEVDIGEVESEKNFIIEAEDFRHIIREARKIQIAGYEEGDTDQFRISLHPMMFFLRLSYQSETAWFCKTMDGSHTIISIPASHFNLEYVHHSTTAPQHHVLDAVFQLGQIADEANLKFSPLQFSLTASNHSLGFVASLHIWDDFFTEYSVDESLSSRISLQSFHNAMHIIREASPFPNDPSN